LPTGPLGGRLEASLSIVEVVVIARWRRRGRTLRELRGLMARFAWGQAFLRDCGGHRSSVIPASNLILKIGILILLLSR
jgi:hypothetical protein